MLRNLSPEIILKEDQFLHLNNQWRLKSQTLLSYKRRMVVQEYSQCQSKSTTFFLRNGSMTWSHKLWMAKTLLILLILRSGRNFNKLKENKILSLAWRIWRWRKNQFRDLSLTELTDKFKRRSMLSETNIYWRKVKQLMQLTNHSVIWNKLWKRVALIQLQLKVDWEVKAELEMKKEVEAEFKEWKWKSNWTKNKD